MRQRNLQARTCSKPSDGQQIPTVNAKIASPCGWPHIGKSARSESTLRLPPRYFSPRPASRFASGAFVLSTLSCRQELPNHLSCHDILGEPFIVLGYACSRSNSRRQKTTKARIIYEGII